MTGSVDSYSLLPLPLGVLCRLDSGTVRWYQLHENDSRTQEMLDELSSSDSSDSEEEEEKPTPKPGTKKYQQLKEQKEKK